MHAHSFPWAHYNKCEPDTAKGRKLDDFNDFTQKYSMTLTSNLKNLIHGRLLPFHMRILAFIKASDQPKAKSK